jgi:hypothetical protein
MGPIVIGLSSLASRIWTHCVAIQTAGAHAAANAPLAPQQIAQSSTQTVSYETAAIAAVGALLGVILKDFVFKLVEEHRTKRETLRAVYARYADPLSLATVSLLWRLHEALEQPGRGRFLKLVGVPTSTNKYSTFGAYKKVSTLYRLAALLGWVRACRREFSYLKVAESEAHGPIEEAITRFEQALADGPAVAIERLEKLCSLWGIAGPLDKDTSQSLAVDLEIAIDEYFQNLDVDEVSLLSAVQKSELASRAAKVITTSFSLQDLPQAVLEQSWARAVQIVDFKEAWIYRDWQSAIGDHMLHPIDGAERRFEVVGFSEFESMCINGTEVQKKWILRLSAVFDGIDLSWKDPYDHRPSQLGAVLNATASLALALSHCVDKRNISDKSRALARRITEETQK